MQTCTTGLGELEAYVDEAYEPNATDLEVLAWTVEELAA
jgi:hypothetical protein